MSAKKASDKGASRASILAGWNGDPQFMQSLARGLLALETIVVARGKPISARLLSTATGLSLAAAQRCIYTLDALNYVRANRNGAVPGPELAELVRGYTASSPLVYACGPILDALHEKLGVTTSLATFAGNIPTIVASHSTESLLRIDIPVGAIVPLHSTSIGKLFLSTLADADLDRRLDQIEFTPHTLHTIVAADELRREVEVVRKRGYATTDQELVKGVRTASVPVTDSTGRAVGCINVTTLRAAVPLRELQGTMVPALREASGELARMLS